VALLLYWPFWQHFPVVRSFIIPSFTGKMMPFKQSQIGWYNLKLQKLFYYYYLHSCIAQTSFCFKLIPSALTSATPYPLTLTHKRRCRPTLYDLVLVKKKNIKESSYSKTGVCASPSFEHYLKPLPLLPVNEILYAWMSLLSS